MSKPTMQWEAVERDKVREFEISRAKVPGGWLLRVQQEWTEHTGEVRAHVGLSFYPDPEHEWDGGSLA